MDLQFKTEKYRDITYLVWLVILKRSVRIYGSNDK